MKYHLVWTPKYRGKVLGPQKVKDELRRTFETITRWKHWEIIELNIQEDHIHMILSASPRDSISYIMQMIKGTKAQLG
ncbi:IS200/IS605 family transposase [Candidatus Nomurabacteria bacterium]|nr:IS200/IS605 family transposase [Candidatus Nomurabacteria bacterium]MCB9814413.1 IS200/IS605 family transposase [Candidatus Nomurabacteria bacterium]